MLRLKKAIKLSLNPHYGPVIECLVRTKPRSDQVLIHWLPMVHKIADYFSAYNDFDRRAFYMACEAQ
jgi:hypothetical protein